MNARASKAEPIILTDRREQNPLTFLHSEPVTLTTGDYSIRTADRDYRDLISVERKSLPDLFGCVGQQRERFERCLERLATYPYCAIVVEATFADILSGARHSQVHPNSAIGSLVAWSTRYRLPIWLAGNREHAAMVVTKILHNAVKYHDAGEGEAAR